MGEPHCRLDGTAAYVRPRKNSCREGLNTCRAASHPVRVDWPRKGARNTKTLFNVGQCSMRKYLGHMPRNWTEQELLIAMNLYCRLPFGQFDHRTELIKLVAPKIGRSPDALAMKLSNLASLDSYHQKRGISGLKGASNLDRKIWSDFQQNWTAMAEKSEAAFETLAGQPDISAPESETTIALPNGPSEAERIVKTRRLQRFFRNAILASYENRCALTGMAVPQLLVASHIIPWSENEKRRADPTNGLCLNALHDKAFDRHLITFDEPRKSS